MFEQLGAWLDASNTHVVMAYCCVGLAVALAFIGGNNSNVQQDNRTAIFTIANVLGYIVFHTMFWPIVLIGSFISTIYYSNTISINRE